LIRKPFLLREILGGLDVAHGQPHSHAFQGHGRLALPDLIARFMISVATSG
jgi:hypothetical protein